MQLAQINIAEMKYPLDSPEMHDFTSNLDRINALAEGQPGFVWRLKDENGNATEIQAFDNPAFIVNMSVWEDPETLKDFTYKTVHAEFVRRRKEWFHLMGKSHYVLWWVADGHRPTPREGREKLEYLHKHGATQAAFDFKKLFAPA